VAQVTRGARLGVAILVLATSSCASLPWPFSNRDGLRSGFSQEDLGTELAAFSARFAAIVNNTSDEIQDQAKRRIVRRRALVWRLQMPPLMEEAAFSDPPQFAFFATLLVAKAQLLYLTEGAGKALFDELQPMAVEAATDSVNDILAIGAQFLTRSQLAEVEERTREFAARYPIQGRDFSVQRIPRALVRGEAFDSLSWLISLPLAPFTALRGVDSGAAAIHDFNRTAQEFSQIIRQMPERIRGQLDLFVYDLEARDTVEDTVASLGTIAASAERLSITAQQLPDDLRKALLDSQQPIESVGRVVEQANALAAPLAETATKLEEASAHWLAMLGPRDEKPPDPNARPFDVRDWQATANSIGSAAAELRGLATDVETASGATALESVIDRAFWRGVTLLVVFFALLILYRVVASRLAGRAA
jgi:hypothetical protein